MGQLLDTASFIREGLSRYEDARETVIAFQTGVYDILTKVWDAKTDWRHFSPVRSAGALQLTRAQGTVFLHAYSGGHIPGRKDKVWLSLGLYWSPPLRRTAAVVAAATCWGDAANPTVRFGECPLPSGLCLVPLYKRSEPRVVADVGPESDLEQVLTTLLDAADEAFGPNGDAPRTEDV